MKAITRAQVITPQGVLANHAVLFTDTILAVEPMENLQTYSLADSVDADNQFVSPGWIDVHIHGCHGFDAMDENNRAIGEISTALARTGVTAFLPTTMTMERRRIETALTNIRRMMNKSPGATVLGCHLEGPFISRQYKGAQAETHILPPDFSLIAAYADVIKILTLAPEIPGAQECIRAAAEHNILPSIGHSAATYEEALAAIQAGARHITHTFNAMPPLHHRNPGVIGAALDSETCCELIADNIHVHPAVQRMLLAAKGRDKVILVTDAMRAALLPDGQYDLGGQSVEVRQGKAVLADGVIAGSVLTMDQAVSNIRNNTGLALEEVARMAAMNPAKQLGIDKKKGSIECGKDADFVVLDENGGVSATFVAGKQVYQKNE